MTDQTSKSKSSIEEMLRQRQQIDQAMQEQFGQKITVMFTDIKGSTSYFETYGDLDGRLMVQKHNDLLFPLIEKHQGRVIKTIGDAIMAVFEDAEQGVLAATAMQQTLFGHNKGKKSPRERIPVRIGLATGDALVEQKDVYGDVVNLASRIESQADAEEILIYEDTYKLARKNRDITCRFHKAVQVKGKAMPVKLYRVVWGDEELTPGAVRSDDGMATEQAGTMLLLEVIRDRGKLKVSLSERSASGESAVRQYEELTADRDAIDRLSASLLGILHQASRGGKVDNDRLNTLKEDGEKLLQILVSSKIANRLKNAPVGSLQLHINDELVAVPWELLYTGCQFIALQFEIGRLVSTRQSGTGNPVRQVAPPLKMLVVADPKGDLVAARQEGEELLALADSEGDTMHAELHADLKVSECATAMQSYDIVHYAGHTNTDANHGDLGAWSLSDGSFCPSAILQVSGNKRPMPAMVFANACQSGQSSNWHQGGEQSLFGMANAFLLAGTRHFIGTLMDLPDKAGKLFALTVYQSLSRGTTIGGALHHARTVLVEKFGEDSLLWAAHLLYGDPGVRYIVNGQDGERSTASSEQMRSISAPLAANDATPAHAANSGMQGWVWAVAAVAVIGLGFGIYGTMRQVPVVPHQPQMVMINQKPASAPAVDMAKAISLYRAGKLDQAMPMLQAQVTAHGDDKMASAFLRDIQHQLALKNDQSKQKQVDALVADLLAVKDAQPQASSAPADDWSSKKLAVTLLDMRVRGKIPLQDGAVEYIPLGISEGLQENGRIHVVDRALLNKILQELKLGRSDLADPTNQLKVGRILSARALITGSIVAMGKQGRVSLRVINTETTEIIAQAREAFDTNTDPFELVDGLQQKLAQAIVAAFPLWAVVTAVDGDQLTLSAGSDAGLKVGMKLEAVDGSGAVTTIVRVEALRATATGAGVTVGTKLQQTVK